MKSASILFLLIFAVCAVDLSGQNSQTAETEKSPTQYRDVYVKYEVDENAVFIDLPKPELTPEAIENFVPQEINTDMILKADGTIDGLTTYGSLKHGMQGRVIAAVRKIKFKQAVSDAKKVSQRTHVKYGIKICENKQICTYAFEFTP